MQQTDGVELWSLAFRTAFTSFFEGQHMLCLIHCCHYIDRYVSVNTDSPIAQWEPAFRKFEDTLLGNHRVHTKGTTKSYKNNKSNKSNKNNKGNKKEKKEDVHQLAEIPAHLVKNLPKKVQDAVKAINKKIQNGESGSHSHTDSEPCVCPVPDNREITRWYTLKAFTIHRMIYNLEVTHEEENIIIGKLLLENAARLVHYNQFSNDPEFSYLKRECKLKKAMLYIDYLHKPWEAFAILKKIKQSPRDEIEERQDDLMVEYFEKCNHECMMWYIRKSSRK